MTAFNKIGYTDKKDWLELRNNGIGGSDAAVVCGMSRFKSPLQLFCEKTGLLLPDDISGKESVHWGNTLEPVLAEHFTQIHPEFSGFKKPEEVYFSLADPFMFASIDGECTGVNGEMVGVEFKTTGYFNKSEWENDSVPPHYVLQCQHYMAVTGYERWIICALIGGQEYVERILPRDENIINFLTEQESAFWQRVENNDPPEPDGSKQTWEVLKKLYPQSNDNLLELNEDDKTRAEEYLSLMRDAEGKAKEAKHALGELETLRDSYRQRLVELIGENEGILLSDCIVTYKTVERKEHFVPASSYRKFSVQSTAPKKRIKR